MMECNKCCSSDDGQKKLNVETDVEYPVEEIDEDEACTQENVKQAVQEINPTEDMLES